MVGHDQHRETLRRRSGWSKSSNPSTSASKRGDTSWIEASSSRSRWRVIARPPSQSTAADPIKKASLVVHRRISPLRGSMRIADVSAFYTPAGGGVRTYVEAKLKAAARFGHELVMIVPGPRQRGRPGAVPARTWFRSRRRRCRSTAGIAISTTNARFTRCSMPGNPTMSKPRRPGRARRWSAAGRGAPAAP